MKTIILIFIIVFINNLSAKDILLNLTDSSLTQNIRLDSINFVNNSLGVDVTVANPTKINFEDVVKIASSVKKINDEFKIIKHQNKIIISGEQLINKIQVYDILGKEILSNSYNSNEVEFVLNSNEMYNFIYIYTDKGVYFNKIMNLENVSYVGPRITNSEDNWDLTFYATGCKTKSLSVSESQLGDRLDIKMEIKLIRMDINVKNIQTSFNKKNKSSNESNIYNSSGKGTHSFSDSLNFTYIKNKTRLRTVYDNEQYHLDSTKDHSSYKMSGNYYSDSYRVFISDELEVYGFGFIGGKGFPPYENADDWNYILEFFKINFKSNTQFKDFIDSEEDEIILKINNISTEYYYLEDAYLYGSDNTSYIDYFEEIGKSNPESVTIKLTKVN